MISLAPAYICWPGTCQRQDYREKVHLSQRRESSRGWSEGRAVLSRCRKWRTPLRCVAGLPSAVAPRGPGGILCNRTVPPVSGFPARTRPRGAAPIVWCRRRCVVSENHGARAFFVRKIRGVRVCWLTRLKGHKFEISFVYYQPPRLVAGGVLLTFVDLLFLLIYS